MVGKMVQIPEFCLKDTNAARLDARWPAAAGGLHRSHAMTLSRGWWFCPRLKHWPARAIHFTTRSIDSAAQDLKIQPRGKSLGLKPKSAPAKATILPPSPVDEAQGTLWFSTFDIGDPMAAQSYTRFIRAARMAALRVCSHLPLYGSSGVLSPDDTQSAFLSWGKDTPSLVIARLDGKTAPQRLGMKPSANPVWSPDGTQLALLTSSGESQVRSIS